MICNLELGGRCSCVQTAPDRIVAASRKLRFCKLTLTKWAEAGKCMCCSGDLGKAWCIDHDHETGVVRGVVCRRCNIGLHYIDNRSFMRDALHYVAGNLSLAVVVPNQQPPEQRRLSYSIEEAAKVLGLSVWQVHKRIDDGLIRAVNSTSAASMTSPRPRSKARIAVAEVEVFQKRMQREERSKLLLAKVYM